MERVSAGDVRNLYKILAKKKPEGKRALRQARHRWNVNRPTNIGLKVIPCTYEDCVQLFMRPPSGDVLRQKSV
jgi:hypothetical protein